MLRLKIDVILEDFYMTHPRTEIANLCFFLRLFVNS